MTDLIQSLALLVLGIGQTVEMVVREKRLRQVEKRADHYTQEREQAHVELWHKVR